MTVIRKQILVNGAPHYVEISSSLDLEEVEITGSDPATGKTVHISLSGMIKTPPKPLDIPPPASPQPLEMPMSGINEGLAAPEETAGNPNVDDALRDLFSQ